MLDARESTGDKKQPPLTRSDNQRKGTLVKTIHLADVPALRPVLSSLSAQGAASAAKIEGAVNQLVADGGAPEQALAHVAPMLKDALVAGPDRAKLEQVLGVVIGAA